MTSSAAQRREPARHPSAPRSQPEGYRYPRGMQPEDRRQTQAPERAPQPQPQSPRPTQRTGLTPAAARARIEAAFRKPLFSGKLFFLIPAIAAVWLLAIGYMVLTPPVYTSRWSLILPAANNGSSVTLETIGQTSSQPTHPFGSVALSPKVIYKEIAKSAQVLEAAAREVGLTERQFGKARIKLIDETSLMMFQMKGRTPEQAQAKSKALLKAFEAQLNVLREDEHSKRAAFVGKNLKIYRANLEKIREKIVEFKHATGILSVDQFKEAAASEEKLRRTLADRRAKTQNLLAEQSRLIGRVQLSPELAAATVRLASDPEFEQLAKVYAAASAKAHAGNVRYGPNHPVLRNARMKAAGSLAELTKIARGAGLAPTVNLAKIALILNTSHQSDLLRKIVANESLLAGGKREIETLENELTFQQFKVIKLGKDAARLEALMKDHLVAEAVFTSAAARLDISRADQFSSYPMIQVLAAPNLPENRSQPRMRYAFAAGLLGTLFVLLAWGAIWARGRFNRKR